MSIPNYTTGICNLKESEENLLKNTQISLSERIKIETLIKENYTTKEISTHLRRPIRTLQNEVATRKIYLLKGTFCKDCKNNLSCNIARNCDMNIAFGKCGQKECKKCPVSTCQNFVKKVKCYESNKCNTCDGCKKLHSCNNQKTQYTAVAAHNDYLNKRSNCKKTLKIFKIEGLIKYIQDNILKNKFSPDAISGRIKYVTTSFSDTVCTATIYNAINNSKIPKISNLNLKLKCKLKIKKQNKISNAPNTHRIGREIDKRVDEEINPTSIGHFELDLVEGIKGGSLLLTFVDRFSSELFIRKIPNKSQESVHLALDSIEKEITKKYNKKVIQSITTDNGNEFKNFENIEKSCLDESKRCKLFYAMPYCSWQKGKIEQSNWIIRTYIYKGQDINDFNDSDICKIQKTINNMPRKRLKYLTPIEYTNISLKIA